VKRAVLAVSLVPMLVAACGGQDRGPRLTKAQFASKADAICAKYNDKVSSLGNPQTLTELADVADNTVPVLQDAIRDLGKLNPPEAQEDTVADWLDSVEQLKKDLEEIGDQADKGSMKGVQAVVPKADQHNKRSNELATALGMRVCNAN
jgi:hypothetical protein